MTDTRPRLLATWRVLSSALVQAFSVPWVLLYLAQHRLSPMALVYVNAKVPSGIDPAQSKYAFYKAIAAHDPALAALYPRTVCIAAQTRPDERLQAAQDFMRIEQLHYPIIAKPDTGSRSIGAYRVEGEAGLRYLSERISVDYLVEEYCPGPVEVGLYFVRSPDHDHPSQYGIAIKTHSYIAAAQPHRELVPLLTHFLIEDKTAELTTELEEVIRRIADAVPFDMGRLDVRAPSLEQLLADPMCMHILEINAGFDAADLHATDLRHPFSTRFKMTLDKWNYALQLGAAYYAAAHKKVGLAEYIPRYIKYGLLLDSMHKNLYR